MSKTYPDCLQTRIKTIHWETLSTLCLQVKTCVGIHNRLQRPQKQTKKPTESTRVMHVMHVIRHETIVQSPVIARIVTVTSLPLFIQNVPLHKKPFKRRTRLWWWDNVVIYSRRDPSTNGFKSINPVLTAEVNYNSLSLKLWIRFSLFWLVMSPQKRTFS